MNISEIEALIQKYDEGLTTLREEEILRIFFQKQEVPSHLASYSVMFLGFTAESQKTITDPGFLTKMDEKLIEENKDQLHEMEVAKPHSRLSPRLLAAFAGLTLFVTLTIISIFIIRNTPPAQTALSPEQAYETTRVALEIFSGNLNAGLRHLEPLSAISKVTATFEEFDKFFLYQSTIINPDEFYGSSLKNK